MYLSFTFLPALDRVKTIDGTWLNATGWGRRKGCTLQAEVGPHRLCDTSLSPSVLSNQMTTPDLFCSFLLPRRVSRHDVSADILVLSSEADGTQGQMPG